MKQSLETIPIWDAFQEDTECPLCLLAGRAEDLFLDRYLDEMVMDAACRTKVRTNGFCNEHLHKLRDRRDNLGLALTLETMIAAVLEAGEREQGSLIVRAPVPLAWWALRSAVGRLGRWLPLRSRRKGLAVSRNWFANAGGGCIVCAHIDDLVGRYCHIVADMYADDEVFHEAFLNSRGFCLPHTLKFVEAVADLSPPERYREVISQAFRLMHRSLRCLSDELREVIKRYDYRFSDESWNGLEDSVDRAIHKLVGLRGLKV